LDPVADPGDRIHESLILCFLGAIRSQSRLTVRFCGEFRCPHIRHPHLNWSQALLAQTCPMGCDAVSDLRGIILGHGGRLHVTILEFNRPYCPQSTGGSIRRDTSTSTGSITE